LSAFHLFTRKEYKKLKGEEKKNGFFLYLFFFKKTKQNNDDDDGIANEGRREMASGDAPV
jgi:hypothetical protein